MKLYGAIDLHSSNNVTVLIDEQDEVVYQKRLPNDLPLIVQQLSPYVPSIQGIVVESTYSVTLSVQHTATFHHIYFIHLIGVHD